MKLSMARRLLGVIAFVAISIGLILNTGTGTLSSFGWQAIAAICPLGAVESIIASKTIFPRALIVLGLAILFLIVFGKAFCSWLCPVSPIRSLWRFIEKRRGRKSRTERGALPDPEVAMVAEATTSSAVKSCTSCSSCATKHGKWDSRHLILGGSLLSAAIFGFPVFCLVCPIGLTFGTVILLWQWFNFDNVSLSLLVYPAILIVELLVLRKWCAKLCPLGAMLSLMSLPNRFFRPKVDQSKCLREKGADCSLCHESCPEDLDPHFKEGMNECSKCGLCLERCPTRAITIPFKQK
jgi:ferredoxin-type protein NapH